MPDPGQVCARELASVASRGPPGGLPWPPVASRGLPWSPVVSRACSSNQSKEIENGRSGGTLHKNDQNSKIPQSIDN